MTLTASDKAAEKLKEHLIQRCLNVGLGYRVINNMAESGKDTFSMELDKEHPGDEVVVLNGIRIFLDPANAALLRDYELDYLDEPSGGFRLENKKVAAGVHVRKSKRL